MIDVFDAQRMTAEDFFQIHPDVNAKSDPQLLTDLFFQALANNDVSSRRVLATSLMNWGADVAATRNENANALHLFAIRLQDPIMEAPMLKILLDAGVDPNKQSSRGETPLECMMMLPRFTEEELAPVYDVFFTHPGLDFNMASRSGLTLWDKVTGCFLDLEQRIKDYVAEHGGVLKSKFDS